jgi:xanthine dehydrogenase small subunit
MPGSYRPCTPVALDVPFGVVYFKISSPASLARCMRTYLLLYVNGKRFEIRGELAFLSLAEFLRDALRLTGTKVVCAEGDCGACTVLVGQPSVTGLRFETVDACIQFLYQLDGKQVITIEGLATPNALHPVQEAMIRCHSSQCGYCTPGFVMALAGLCEQREPFDEGSLRLGLTGNLCRCTGYTQILEAARSLDPRALTSLAERWGHPSIIEDLQKHDGETVLIQVPGKLARTFFAPRRLDEAVEFKACHPDAVIVAGGTELGVLRNKKGLDPAMLLSLAHVPGLSEITCDGAAVAIGANVTWTQVEAFAKKALPEFHQIIVRFGSPQIRNVSTLVGNVAHGSPIADALPLLCVMDAELELVGLAGKRRVKINQFYQGYKVKDLAADEIITGVLLPLPAGDELLKLHKVSRRQDLDIATVGAALRVRRAGAVITRAYVAFSGVAPTVVRLPATEAFLQGKRFAESTFREAGRVACGEIQPISDVRGTRHFRLHLVENMMLKFYHDCHQQSEPVVVG